MEAEYNVHREKFGSFEVCVVETELGHAIIHEDSSTITITFYVEGFEFAQKFSCGNEPWNGDDELMAGICNVLGTGEAIETWVAKEL